MNDLRSTFSKQKILCMSLVALCFAFSTLTSPSVEAKRRSVKRTKNVKRGAAKKRSAKKRKLSRRSMKKRRGTKKRLRARRVASNRSRGIARHEAPNKPLSVTGQSRNLNMMLVLRNKKERTTFVKLRTNYKQEIMDSVF